MNEMVARMKGTKGFGKLAISRIKQISDIKVQTKKPVLGVRERKKCLWYGMR